jgi:hypothetical protein
VHSERWNDFSAYPQSFVGKPSFTGTRRFVEESRQRSRSLLRNRLLGTVSVVPLVPAYSTDMISFVPHSPRRGVSSIYWLIMHWSTIWSTIWSTRGEDFGRSGMFIKNHVRINTWRLMTQSTMITSSECYTEVVPLMMNEGLGIDQSCY